MKDFKVNLLVFFVGIVLLFIISNIIINDINKNKLKYIDTIDIQCSGKIIHKEYITRSSREIIVCCIKVHYSNVDSITIFDNNHYTFFRIKNNIATKLLSYNVEEADSVSININNDRKERYFKNGILLEEYPLSLGSGYATYDDLINICP